MKETKEILLSKITLPKFYKDWVVLPFEKIVIENKYLPQIKKLTEKDLKPSGEYPVIGQGENEIEGYSNDLLVIIKDFLPIIIFGDHTRRFKFVNKPVAIFADGAKIIKPYKVVNTLFFYYFLKSIEIENQGYSRHNKFLSVISVPIPPLSEQNAIAEKLDILFSHLETSRKKLAKIPKYIAKFRQAVLQRAVSGELTEDWRDSNNIPLKYEETIIGSIANVTKLAGFEYSKYFSPKQAGEIPIVRAQNIKKGYFVNNNLLYINEDTSNKLSRSQIIGSELLMVYVGASVGNVCIAPSYKAHLAPNVAKITLKNKNIYNEFLNIFFQSKDGLNAINVFVKITTHPNLSMKDIRQIKVYYPIIQEQHEIVRQVELLFAIADKAQKQYETAMEYFQKLEKSVLLQAFSGELVEAKAQTESLEDLLERIKVEREKLEKEKKVLRKEQATFKQHIKNMEKKSIEEMLKEAPKKELSVEEIWQASVYFENKEVEKFYEELCELYDDKKIDKDFLDDKKITTIVTLQEYAN